MKIKEVRALSDTFSSKASELCRQLAFAGIAVVWVFKTTNQNALLPNEFLLPLFLFVVTLGVDFLQYVLGYLEWSIINRIKESRHTCTDEDTDVGDVPWWVNFHTLLFYAKIVLIVVGYWHLANVLWARLG